MTINIELIKNYKRWHEHKIINKSLIKKITSNVLERFDNFAKIKEFELSILLTNNSEMIDLNTKFRGVNKTTNVLSFPNEELNWRDLRLNDRANNASDLIIEQATFLKQKNIIKFAENFSYMYLGDIAFSYELTNEEAVEQKKTFENHFIHLLIHSILHLIGFDHQHDEEANIMENLEIEILSYFNIPSPY